MIMNINSPAAVDPYVRWAQATNFKDYDLQSDFLVSVIAKRKAVIPAPFNQLKFSDGTSPNVNPIYSLSNFASDFFTAKFERKYLDEFAGMVERFELGTAISPDAAKGMIPPLGLSETGRPAKLILGVIDDFIGFGHSCHQGHVERVWSQNELRPQPVADTARWTSCVSMGYGYELTRKSPQTHQPKIPLGAIDYPSIQAAYSHGSHVASLMRGSGADAVKATMFAVHLPRTVLRDTTGGAMSVQVLDGIRYILAHANSKDHIIINVSYGTFAGPHDGTSLLELAMDDLVNAYEGRLQIVFPAGNQYESRCYAKVNLGSDGSKKERLRWKILPDDRTPSFLELWVTPEDAKHLEVEIVSPSGTVNSPKISQGNAWFSCAAPGCTSAVIFPSRNAMSEKSEGVLIALAGTASTTGSGDFSEHGVWQILLHAKQPITVDAYIERDDTFGRPARGRQSYFVDELYEKHFRVPGQKTDSPGDRVIRYGSLNTVVTGNGVVSVGAYTRKEKRTSWYSAAGDTRVSILGKPIIMAPGDQSLVNKGILSAGTFGVSQFRMSGTSVAAPQVAWQMARAMGVSLSGGTIASSMSIKTSAAAGAANQVKSLTAFKDRREIVPKAP
jgi:hypothetical protein